MRAFLPMITVCLWMSIVKAGQFISTYNHLSPQQVIFPQTYSTQSYGLVHPQYYSSHIPEGDILAHPKVVETSIEESSIPSELKKSSHFYNNPYVADALARESLSFNKETVTYDRPSEKIPRTEIIKLINNLWRAHHES